MGQAGAETADPAAGGARQPVEAVEPRAHAAYLIAWLGVPAINGLWPKATGIYRLGESPYSLEDVSADVDIATTAVIWIAVYLSILIIGRVLRERLLHPYRDEAVASQPNAIA